jgi:hypothetical protein
LGIHMHIRIISWRILDYVVAMAVVEVPGQKLPILSKLVLKSVHVHGSPLLFKSRNHMRVKTKCKIQIFFLDHFMFFRMVHLLLLQV